MAELFDKAIARLAARQCGHVTRRQLLAIGMRAGAIEYRIAIGRLIPVYAGVYAVGHLPVTPVARAAGAVLACGDGALLSHTSAASLWGFDKYWGMPFEVTVKGKRTRPGITVHRSRTLTRRDATRQLGIWVTTPARTILDNAPRYSDKRLTRVVNNARHTRYLNLDDLADVVARNPHHPGTKRLLQFVQAPVGPTRSELEDEFIAFARRHGLPAPATNVVVNGHEVDVLFVDEAVIVELDSWEFHRFRTSFENDRERDAERLAAGFLTVRVTHERMEHRPEREAARLHKILEARRAA